MGSVKKKSRSSSSESDDVSGSSSHGKRRSRSRSLHKVKCKRRRSGRSTSSSSSSSSSRSREHGSPENAARLSGDRRKLSKQGSRSRKSSSSSSSSGSGEEKKRKVEKKNNKKERKRLKKIKKKLKKLRKKAAQLTEKERLKREAAEMTNSGDENIIGPQLPVAGVGQAMKPMTKEEWEKMQNSVRREIDPETGRSRLVRGRGEIIEEAVSRQRHLKINQEATKGDGEHFQRELKRQLPA